MQNRSNQNVEGEGIFWIKFYGPSLKQESIPIYELGQTLIALQGIINKAHLFRERRLKKGSIVTKDERSKLALQITSKQQGSDEYGLIPFFTDPVVINHLKIVLVDALIALGVYGTAKVIKRHNQKPEQQDNNSLISAIYNQVRILSDRIDNIGGVERIEISAPEELNVDTVKIDKTTQDYIRELQYEPLLGPLEEIEGIVFRLYTERNIAVIQKSPGDYVHVLLKTEDFERVRYDGKYETLIRFKGRPIYYLGRETSKFENFDADQIISMRDQEE